MHMEKWFKNIVIILIFSQLSSACSIDMIAGTEDGSFHDSEATLKILPAFRANLNANENPAIAERFATSNQTALRKIAAEIRRLNRNHPSIRHTLVTQNNDSDFQYRDYITNWKISLELYGNSHYPKGLNYQAPYGNALVDVAITRSGRLYSYKIILSTGSAKLRSAIKNIIHHKAPFSPLSASIQKNTDVLHLTQMWQFRK